MADDGFHEIQLGKKQLFFLFMAATVSLVVAFLIGVWVGRDVRRPENEIVAEIPTAEVTPDTPQPPTQVAANELDYTARLQSGAKGDAKTTEAPKPVEPPTPAAEGAPDQPATPPAKTPAKSAADTKAPAPVESPDPKPASPAKGAATTSTWHLQAAAFKDQAPADTLVARLVKKGYAAYVVTAATGVYPFKVDVGPFADKAAAEAASAKLKKEERLSPLVLR